MLRGTQSVFERVKGVVKTTAGYSGGAAKTATYDQVTTETTGHAESVEVVYDPSKITYGQLLRIFFSVVHDPTQLNRQGPMRARRTGRPSSIAMTSRSELPRRTSRSSMRPRCFPSRSSRRSPR